MRILLSLAFIAATNLHAGPISSGGGRAIVCYNPTNANEIISAKLLDLEEGVQVFGDHLLADSTDIELALETALSRMQNTAYNLFAPSYKITDALLYIRTHYRLEPGDIDMKMFDSHGVVLPENCKAEQAALFFDKDNIVISERIWKALPPLHQAGLLLHEAIYWMDRRIGVLSSKRARRVTSLALSQEWNFEAIISGVPQSYIQCFVLGGKHSTSFGVFDMGGPQLMQVVSLNGELMISKMSVRSPFSFPFETPTDITQDRSAEFTLESAYEGGTKLRFHRFPVFDSQGNAIESKLTFSGEKASYPQSSFNDVELGCWRMPSKN